MFHPAAQMIKYHQKSSNSCYLSRLGWTFNSIGNNRAAYAAENCTGVSLTLQTNRSRNIIDFNNDITKNKLRHKGEQRLRYNMKIRVEKDAFDIINEIIENVTLVQLLDSIGNVNHAISIVVFVYLNPTTNKHFLWQGNNWI